jgi:hypothetical protein
MTSWLLLGLLTVVGAGAAVLGIVQSPKNAALPNAVASTLAAPSYSEVLSEVLPQGKQTEYLNFQGPDRLGGYLQSGNKRSYVVVIGSVLYQSLTVSSNVSTNHLTFYKQQARGTAASNDPAHNYLPYIKQAKNITGSAGISSFSLTKSGEVGSFTYTVSGKYVSEFSLSVSQSSAPVSSVQLDISQIGTAPPVALPTGAKVVAAPSGGVG